MAMSDEEWNVRAGAAALATCLVKTMNETDPSFQERFLKNLDYAYRHFKDDSAAVGADGKPRSVNGAMEIISWTNEMLTGWNIITGQGQPLFK